MAVPTALAPPTLRTMWALLVSLLLVDAVRSTPSIADRVGCESTVELLSTQLKEAQAQVAELVAEAQRTAMWLDAVESILQQQRDPPAATQTGLHHNGSGLGIVFRGLKTSGS